MKLDIKICGLTNVADARLAMDAGADFLGFVLYSGSPRGITRDALLEILDALGSPANAVGVFVNAGRAEVEAIAAEASLAAVQLHGDEAADVFGGLGVPVWRAVRIRGGQSEPSPAAWPAARYVVDADVPGAYGGTGVLADWGGAVEALAGHPLMLSGGLTPANVAGAIQSVRPLGVDVSSGVERSPGRKDHDKIRAFIQAARAAAAGLER